jgi:hypothetical protein
MRRDIVVASAVALCSACDASPTSRAPAQEMAAEKMANADSPLHRTTAAGGEHSIEIARVAACQPTAELNAMVSHWIELADADGSGQISKSEARSFTNFVIGGFFFRADADGDGVVSPEEGLAARNDFLAQYPALTSLLSETRAAAGENPFEAVADMIGIDYGKPLSADDARRAARAALDDLFEVVDRDRDGTITLAEARAASWQAVRTVGQRAFRSVDGNDDGKLDLSEFQAAVGSTAKLAFKAGDANGNGNLTEQEAAVALTSVARQLGIVAPRDGAPGK